jgi:hypothetical protein
VEDAPLEDGTILEYFSPLYAVPSLEPVLEPHVLEPHVLEPDALTCQQKTPPAHQEHMED